MNIYRIKTGKALHSFGDAIGDVPIFGINLKLFQEIIIKKVGLNLQEVQSVEEIHDDNFLTFDDDLIFTEKYLLAAIRLSKNSPTSLEFSFSENSFNLRFLLPCAGGGGTDWCYNFKYYKQKNLIFKNVIINQQIFKNHIRLPKQIVPSGQYNIDQCETWITRIDSPFHLLYANLALNLGRTIKTQKIVPTIILKSFFKIGSRSYSFALRRLNKIGKGCNIHSTAVLEGVELGDNITIGAHCVLRMTKVGDGTTIEDNTVIAFSILGNNTYVSAGNLINLCMTYENVFLIHGPYQFSIYGRNVAVMAVINCDIRLDNKEIVIPTTNGLVNSRQPLLGIAYGHESVVGGGNIIAPGRIIPNNLKCPPPQNIIIKDFAGK